MHKLPSTTDPASLALLGTEEKRRLATQLLRARLSGSEGKPLHALSHGQRALWLLYRLAPESAAYNLYFAGKLPPGTDLEPFRRAFQAVLQRHPSLRSNVREIGGVPVQVVAAEPVLDWEEVDASGMDEAALRSWLSHDVHRPFRLEDDALLRVRVLRLDSGETVLSVVLHHIVADYWSFGIIASELSTLVPAFAAGQSASLPPVSGSYSAYVDWQQRTLTGDAGERELAFWRTTLTPELPDLELPTDRPRPKLQSFRGGLSSFWLSTEASSAVNALARDASTTPFVVLLACFHVFLARYSGQNDICIGSPVTGRSQASFGDVVGYFVNMVVLRTQSGGVGTFRELLASVRRTALDALAHQDYPFSLLVEKLQPPRTLGRSPFFQVAFALQKAQLGAGALHFAEQSGGARLPFGGVELEAVFVPHRRAQFDLTLMMEQVGEEFFGFFEFAVDLFDEPTVVRMKSHFVSLVSALVQNPELAPAEAPMLSAEQLQQIVVGWNPVGDRAPERGTLSEAFQQQVRRTPEACAVRFMTEETSYQRLAARATSLALRLSARGIRPGHRVGICLERSTDLVVALLGIIEAGAAYVPLDGAQPAERLQSIVRDGQLSLILTTPQGASLFGACAPCIQVEGTASGGAERALSPPAPEDVAYVIYTSGTTGEPKGVLVTHEAVLNRLQWMQSEYGLSREERVLQKTPYTFDVSVWEFFWPLLSGATVVLAEPEAHREPSQVLAVLEREQISTVHFVPSMLQEFLALPSSVSLSERLPQLRRVFSSGEALAAEVARRFFERLPGVELYNLYGPTEAAVDVSHHRCVAGESAIPIGRPIANVRLYVLDSGYRPVAPGVTGDLYIGGVCLARGYHGRPDLTASSFVPDAVSGLSGERLYRTGDRARYLSNGELEYRGRLDDQVKVRGFRIELGEVTARLSRHPGVTQVTVVADGALSARRLVAYYVAPSEVTSAVLRAFAAEQLPEHLVPSLFVRLEKLPLGPSGKVDRRSLPAPSAVSEAEYLAPATETETQLAGMWSELLGVERVGQKDDFFELGGHSLLAARLAARISSTWGVSLALRSVFEQPTLERVAALVDSAKESALAPLEPITPADRSLPLPLSFAQERLWFLQQMAPESPYYNMPFALRVRGHLRPEALRAALARVQARHESLRTRFTAGAGRPLQIVEAQAEFDFFNEDLRSLPTVLALERARESAQLFAREPFDLARGALLRVKLMQLEDDQSWLVLVLHHIIADGWSMGVLTHEIGQAYASVVGVPAATLPPLRVQYADFAAWQRRQLGGAALAAQRAYWKGQLAGEFTPLWLPFDRPRPAKSSNGGGRLPVALSADATRALKSLAHNEGATLFMGLFAAFSGFLSELAGADEVRIGTPVANRGRIELEPLIGFFVNALVLRVRLSEIGQGDPSLRELLRAAREITLDAYAHQDLPFEALVEMLEPGRDLRISPLFQVALVLQNAPLPPLDLPDVRFELEDIDNGTTKFDLTLCLIEHEQRLSGYLEYSSDLFERETVARLFAQLSGWLDAVLLAPDAPLSCIAGADSERQATLRGAPLADAPVVRGAPIQVEGGLIHEHFEARARETPRAIALCFEGQELSYDELNQRANELAQRLIAQVNQPNPILAIYAEPSLEMVLAMLAVLKAGGAYLPLDPAYPADRIEALLADAQPAAILAPSALAARFEGRAGLLEIDARPLRKPYPNPARRAKAQDLAYVIYTSGSTGRPKGVMVSHANLVRLLSATQRGFGFGPTDTFSLFHSFAFDFSVWEVFAPLATGGRVVIVPYAVTRAPDEFVALVRDRGVTVLNQTPSAFSQFAQAEATLPSRLDQLRLVIFGGEALDHASLSSFFERYGDERPALVNMYGITETTVHVTWRRVRRSDSAASSLIGHAIPDLDLHVLDPHGQPTARGMTGELYVSGAGLARGYLQRPELTAERFVPNPFGRVGARMYRTGDRVRVNADGELEYLGRLDQQVKIRGFRIELGEIEAALRAHEGVRDAVVSVERPADGSPRIIAYLVANSARSEDAATLGAEQVAGWQVLYDDLYRSPRRPSDAALDTVGWKSSFTGDAIADADMRAWRDRTVERIVSLAPARVWEIGSGSGMLLLNVAPLVSRYLGSDLSRTAVSALSVEVERRQLHQVRLEQRAADDFAGIEPGSFDLIVINSAIQYFPDLAYLEGVLRGAVRALAPGGHVFIGDVRSLPLLEAFHASVGRQRGIRERRLPDYAARSARADEELVVHPDWFRRLPEVIPELAHAETWLKRGAAQTEMARFRYDVLLSTAALEPLPIERTASFAALGSLAGLERWLSERPPAQHAGIEVSDVPNARVLAELSALGAVNDETGIELEELWSLAERYACSARIRYAESGAPGKVDLLVERAGAGAPAPWAPHASVHLAPRWANQPLAARRESQLLPSVREFISARLPQHMVPAAFVCLDAIPLTRNGKIDRAKLPAPDEFRRELSSHFAAPRSAIESSLAELWSDLLGIRPIGIHDDFFALGGHSLMATQLVSRARSTLGLEIPLRALFEHPTIAQLAARLQGAPVLADFPALLPIAEGAQSPLSYAQERMYFLARLDQQGAYNISAAISVSGKLDLGALERAFQRLVERHEVLRTVFEERAGRPEARVRAELPPEFEVCDLCHAGRAAVLARAEAESARGFDLASGPLLRALVLRESHERNVLVLNVHHIAADGWSVAVIVRDLAELYAAERDARPSSLQPLPLQYRSFAAWQQQVLSGDRLALLLERWSKTLAGAPSYLDLPLDHPRPRVQSFEGRAVTFQVSEELSQQLRQLCQAHGSTLFMALIGAFAVLLQRYSAQDDILIGSPIANRNRAEIEQLVGFFVNTLVLRIQLTPEDTVGQLLDHVREVSLQAFALQDVPFERLVEHLRPQRDIGRTPLFQAMFVLQNAPPAKAEVPGLTFATLDVGSKTAKTDLTLELRDAALGGLVGRFEYAAALFDAATIERMTGHYLMILEGLVRGSSQPLASLLRTNDLAALETPARLAAAGAAPTLHGRVEQQARATPAAIAVRASDGQLSYRELDEAADALARRLLAAGLPPEGRVAIALERGSSLIVALLAVMKAGGVYVPLDLKYPSARLAFTLQHAEACVLLTSTRQRAALPVETPSVVFIDEPGELSAGALPWVSPSALAYIIYTSGSTGVPKGVSITHRSAVAFLDWARAALSAEEWSLTLAGTSICFDLSIFEIFAPLSLGGTVLMVEDSLELARREGLAPTLLSAVPSAIAELVRGRHVPASVRTVFIGGEPLRRELVDALYELPHVRAVYNGYGPSEDTTYSSYALVPREGGNPSIGVPVDGTQAYVVDERLRPVPPGVPGQLLLGGGGLARGYWNAPDLTAERFIPDSFSGKLGARLYCTGDRVRLTHRGELAFLGRLDQQLKIRGFRIELGEVEAALGAHPALAEAAVAALKIAGENVLVAYLVAAGERPTSSEIKAWLRARLPEPFIPARLSWLPALPRNPNGKLDRRALPTIEQAFDGEQVALVEPRSAVEKELAAIWCELLGLEQVGIDQDFFDLGGHSLLIMQGHALLRERLGVVLSLDQLFVAPTVRALALVVEERLLADTDDALLEQMLARVSDSTPEQGA